MIRRAAWAGVTAAILSTGANACGCLDLGTAQTLDKAAQANYLAGDANILAGLNAIGTTLHNAYDNIENETAKNIETSLRLKNEMTRIQGEIDFNQKIINQLDAYFIDTLSTGANISAAKMESK